MYCLKAASCRSLLRKENYGSNDLGMYRCTVQADLLGAYQERYLK